MASELEKAIGFESDSEPVGLIRLNWGECVLVKLICGLCYVGCLESSRLAFIRRWDWLQER